MMSFSYVIKDELGIHARPAAMLVQEANKFKSTVGIECNGKSAEISKLFALMSLNIKCNDTITVTVDGADEVDAYTAMKKFIEENV